MRRRPAEPLIYEADKAPVNGNPRLANPKACPPTYASSARGHTGPHAAEEAADQVGGNRSGIDGGGRAGQHSGRVRRKDEMTEDLLEDVGVLARGEDRHA